MPTPRRLDDPFGSTEDPTSGFNYPDPPAPGPADPGAAPPTPYGGPNDKAWTEGTSSAPPAFDRTGFRDAWMGSSGGMDDFLKQHPEYSGVQKAGGSKGDVYQLPSGEIMDLQIAKGLNGENAQHGWTGVGEVHNGQTSYYGPGGPGGAGSAGGSGGAGYGGGSSSTRNSFGDIGALTDALKGLFPGGAFNKDIVNRRTENAAENLHRFQKSQSANDKAALAERGLMGSGPEATAQDRLSSNIADKYSNAVSGIYADESQNADQRMMAALQTAAGMSESEAKNAIDWFRAQNDRDLGWGGLDNQRTLGLGQLALGNTHEANSYDLGRRGVDYNYDALNSNNDNTDIQHLIDILNGRRGPVDTSAEGHH